MNGVSLTTVGRLLGHRQRETTATAGARREDPYDWRPWMRRVSAVCLQTADCLQSFVTSCVDSG